MSGVLGKIETLCVGVEGIGYFGVKVGGVLGLGFGFNIVERGEGFPAGPGLLGAFDNRQNGSYIPHSQSCCSTFSFSVLKHCLVRYTIDTYDQSPIYVEGE